MVRVWCVCAIGWGTREEGTPRSWEMQEGLTQLVPNIAPSTPTAFAIPMWQVMLSCNLWSLSVEVCLSRCLSSLTHSLITHVRPKESTSLSQPALKCSSTPMQSPLLQTLRQQTDSLPLALFSFSSSKLDYESLVYPWIVSVGLRHAEASSRRTLSMADRMLARKAFTRSTQHPLPNAIGQTMLHDDLNHVGYEIPILSCAWEEDWNTC